MNTLRFKFLVGMLGAVVIACAIGILVHALLVVRGVAPSLGCLAGMAVAVLLILIPLAVGLQRAVFRPLGQLIRANRRFASGNEDEALIPEEDIPNTEFGDLMRSRNDVILRLLDQQSDLVAAAAASRREHESAAEVGRVLGLLSGCAQAVIEASDETALMNEVCRLAVEEGGYRLAWVALAEQDDAKSVRPAAQAGFEARYLETVNITWDDTARGRGPTGTCIRTGEPSVVRNILKDPDYTPWSAEAAQRGYVSSVALPLSSGEGTFGALSIYAKEPDAFDAEEVRLLSAVAAHLSYGIGVLRASSFRTAPRPSPAGVP